MKILTAMACADLYMYCIAHTVTRHRTQSRVGVALFGSFDPSKVDSFCCSAREPAAGDGLAASGEAAIAIAVEVVGAIGSLPRND